MSENYFDFEIPEIDLSTESSGYGITWEDFLDDSGGSYWDDLELNLDDSGGGSYWDNYDSSDIFYDWNDQSSGFQLDSLFTDDDEYSEWLKSLGSQEEEEGGLFSFLGKVPGSIWDKLLDFGMGSLGQWLANKNRDRKLAKRSGGGGGSRPATTVVTAAIPEGTRKPA